MKNKILQRPGRVLLAWGAALALLPAAMALTPDKNTVPEPSAQAYEGPSQRQRDADYVARAMAEAGQQNFTKALMLLERVLDGNPDPDIELRALNMALTMAHEEFTPGDSARWNRYVSLLTATPPVPATPADYVDAISVSDDRFEDNPALTRSIIEHGRRRFPDDATLAEYQCNFELRRVVTQIPDKPLAPGDTLIPAVQRVDALIRDNAKVSGYGTGMTALAAITARLLDDNDRLRSLLPRMESMAAGDPAAMHACAMIYHMLGENDKSKVLMCERLARGYAEPGELSTILRTDTTPGMELATVRALALAVADEDVDAKTRNELVSHLNSSLLYRHMLPEYFYDGVSDMSDEDRAAYSNRFAIVYPALDSLVWRTLEWEDFDVDLATAFATVSDSSWMERQSRPILEHLAAGDPDLYAMLRIADAYGYNDTRARDDMMERALRQYPGNPVALIMRANYRMAREDWQGVVDDLTQVTDTKIFRATAVPEWKDMDTTSVIDDRLALLAHAYGKLGLHDKAVPLLRTIMQRHPDDAMAKNNLAYEMALEGKDLANALKLVDTALATAGDNITMLDTRAWILYRMGSYPKALDAMKQCIRTFGIDWDVLTGPAGVEKARQLLQADGTQKKITDLDDTAPLCTALFGGEIDHGLSNEYLEHTRDILKANGMNARAAAIDDVLELLGPEGLQQMLQRMY